MSKPDAVAVFNYWVSGDTPETPSVSVSKATRQTIVGNALGNILEGTRELVSSDHIGEDGHYRRLATGWGDLDQLPA